jgi:hypothetical protein
MEAIVECGLIVEPAASWRPCSDSVSSAQGLLAIPGKHTLALVKSHELRMRSNRRLT